MLENEAFGCAETAVLGAWIRLMRYCCVHENGGRISGAKGWDARTCMFLLRLDPAELRQKSALWTWKGDDLLVLYFPVKSFAKMKKLRALGKKGADSRWRKADATRHAPAMANAIADGMAYAKPDAIADANAKDKYKSKSKDKGKGKSKPSVAEATDGGKPHALAEVIFFFGQKGAPPELAAKFFNHYTANGWKQGGGLLIQSWRAQGDKWIGDWKAETSKKSAGGGAAPDTFNPNQEHAHTGGVELAN